MRRFLSGVVAGVGLACLARAAAINQLEHQLHVDAARVPSRVAGVAGRSHVTNPKAGLWDPDRKGVTVVLGRGRSHV